MWWLPMLLLAGFALLFAALFRDRLLPARDVRVVVAVALADGAGVADAGGIANREPRVAVESAAGRLLFQASGWLEADPFPLRATALAAGVIDEVHVLEGQLVAAGDRLVSLVDEDARLRHERAAAMLEMKQAEFDAHCVEVQVRLQELAGEQAGLVSDQAAHEEAADRLARLLRAPEGASTEGERVAARLETTRREAAVDARQARIRGISWDFNRIAYETLAHIHMLEVARNELDEAALELRRTRVVAPAAGRIQRLMAAPGEKKMLAMDEMESATVAILYDPERLQVRVDVPLADAAHLSIGQRARIRCNLLPDKAFHGEVTRILGEADIQRNTLQAKVRVIDPDDRLRPEMLCRVEFFGNGVGERASAASVAAPTGAGLVVFVPEAAIVDGSSVWICDPDARRVARRAVALADGGPHDGWMRLDGGVNPGEWIVSPAVPSLRPNQRVNPITTP